MAGWDRAIVLGNIIRLRWGIWYAVLKNRSAEDPVEAAVLVGPDPEAGDGIDRTGGGSDGGQVEKARPGGYQDPVGSGFFIGFVAVIGNQHGLFAMLGGRKRNDGRERKIFVRDVYGENARRFEMPPIESEGFAGEKMHRDGVAREGVKG